MARSVLCCLCGELKEPERKNHGYCKACHHRKRTEERAKARAEKGLPAWGSGRNPLCKDCGITKERRDSTYCRACRNARQKVERAGEKPVPRASPGLCPCGKERAPGQLYYCLECKREYDQKWRDSKKLPAAEIAKRKEEHRKDAHFKRATRKYTETCINIGILIKQPCEVCGTNEEVEAHHDDYYKPLDIRWLCRGHHLDHHLQAEDLKRR